MNLSINPNWHVVLMHYPLALLVLGVLIEIFSFLWRQGTFRAAGRWMILLGALSMAPVLLSGIYALHDVVLMNNPNVDDHSTWNERITKSPLTQEQWRMLQWHLWLGVGATAAAMIAVVVWLGSSDRLRQKLHYPLLVALALSVGVMLAGAWFGGEAVYRHQVATGVSETPHHEETEHDALLAPSIQLHLTLAGFALAVVAASVGLSYRASAVMNEAIVATQRPADPNDQVDSLMRSINPQSMLTEMPLAVPAGRFWLMGALLLLLTAVVGLWYLAFEAKTWDVKVLWEAISDSEMPRRVLHVIFGVSLLVLSLLMAGVARWAPARRDWLTIFAALLVLATAAQVWFGLLILYDSPVGPITGINP